jgi:hypothetical protein
VSATGEARGPVISVLHGAPTPDELAVILTVLLAAVPPGTAAAPPSLWADRARALHPTPRPGPRAWRASALPR